jgi:protein tyrosine phosphatase (PTP) superfamily phosphohydrolase (DUF442 family)
MWELRKALVKTFIAGRNTIRRRHFGRSNQPTAMTDKDKSMSEARVETIINYYELADGLVSSGQPSPEEFAAIRDAGYQVVINLVPTEASMALANEQAVVVGLGLRYIHIPVIWDKPTPENLDAFYEAMQKHKDNKVYVHCEVNYRASSFLYLYRRKFLGVDEKQARQDLQWIWAPNPTWAKFITEMRERDAATH